VKTYEEIELPFWVLSAVGPKGDGVGMDPHGEREISGFLCPLVTIGFLSALVVQKHIRFMLENSDKRSVRTIY